MPGQNIPNEPPPSYSTATGSSSSRPTGNTNSGGKADISHLNIPGGASSSHGIPTDRRRSMEDEQRPLPKGWVRTFDPESSHHFYVDTTKEPPRSIWVHPYDDDQYLSTLSSSQREQVEQESLGRGNPPSKADILAGHTDDEDDDHHASGASSSSSSAAAHGQELPPRPTDGKKSFGRKLKDKMTGMTHEQREVERQKRQEEERQIYERHQRIRAAMAKAAETGQPQLMGKDKDGKDLYIEPPSYAGGSGGYPGSGYGYNPYSSSGGMYSAPNSRYVRPAYPYSRPYGGGYGGGYGMPLALGGGLLGGMMLGDMMGGMGGMGMGGMGGFGGGGF